MDKCNAFDYKLGWKTNIYSVCDVVILMMLMKTITSVGLGFSFFKVGDNIALAYFFYLI